MMLINYRLELHRKNLDRVREKLERKAISDIVNYLRSPDCKNILDSRDPQMIKILLDFITKKVAEQQEFKKNKIDVTELGNEVKEDIMLLCFTFDYVQEYQDDLQLSFDEDTYSDYIDQFRDYLQAEQLTELTTNKYEPGIKGVENAFKDAQDAWQMGRSEKLSLGDLFLAERVGPSVASDAIQVQTMPSMDPGFPAVLKGFGGAKKRQRKTPSRVGRGQIYR